MVSGEAHATLIEIGRSSQKETSMANDNKDQPVLGHIDTLVKEEERLYAQRELTDEERGPLSEDKGRTGPVLGFVASASSLARVWA
jgi:hypothetical protein